ncbi:hypothetical protein CV016_07945 [Yersinia kristensenii]|nr:hypothetical protein CV016_07945 [Yersinia kristensenii]
MKKFLFDITFKVPSLCPPQLTGLASKKTLVGKVLLGRNLHQQLLIKKTNFAVEIHTLEDCCWNIDYFSRRELSIKKGANYSKYDNEHITVKKYYRVRKSLKNNT